MLEVFERATPQQTVPKTPEWRRGDIVHGLLGSLRLSAHPELGWRALRSLRSACRAVRATLFREPWTPLGMPIGTWLLAVALVVAPLAWMGPLRDEWAMEAQAREDPAAPLMLPGERRRLTEARSDRAVLPEPGE
jgi:hypothetical protein